MACLIKVLMATCRVVRVAGEARHGETLSRTGGRAVYATWHQRMPYFAHYFGPRRLTIMISRSRDGEYAARIAAGLGFRNVRGSSTRGGTGALIGVMRKIRKGATGGMLADGPRGPARVAKMGAVAMARNAGAPLIPVTWGADRCWVLNTWDRYLIPKPFARVVVLFGDPIRVPRDAKGGALEPYRRLLEDRLNAGTRWCDAQFGEERPWRRVKGPGIPDTGPFSPGESEDRSHRKGGGEMTGVGNGGDL